METQNLTLNPALLHLVTALCGLVILVSSAYVMTKMHSRPLKSRTAYYTRVLGMIALPWALTIGSLPFTALLMTQAVSQVLTAMKYRKV